jgi:hypothetical protein
LFNSGLFLDKIPALSDDYLEKKVESGTEMNPKINKKEARKLNK